MEVRKVTDEDIELACQKSIKVRKLIKKLDKYTDKKKKDEKVSKEWVKRGLKLEKLVMREVIEVVSRIEAMGVKNV